MLKAGDPVPDFAFASETFGAISARALRGKRYVLYFYPKDDTPGCTREACGFRDNLPKFAGARVQIYGVSADDEKSHIRFSRKHQLPFKLIPDPDHVICERFGTWIEKSMYGRSYMGVSRTTFVIGADGTIERVWEKVAPDGHAEEVLAWLNGESEPGAAAAKSKAKVAPAAPKAKPSAAKPVVHQAATGAASKAAATPGKAQAGPLKKSPGKLKPAVASKSTRAKPAAKKPASTPRKPAGPVARKAAAKPKPAAGKPKKPQAAKKPTKPGVKKSARAAAKPSASGKKRR